MTRVRRTDFAGSLRGVTHTSIGGLRVPAAVTRVGVLRYQDASGRTWGELRHPDEVFAPASLATLRTVPVTDLHPTEAVTPETFRTHATGHVCDDVAVEDQRLVVATLAVQDAAMIGRIDAGERREVSCGYTCEVEPTAGVWEGEPYEGIQRGIVYNHVALGPLDWARGGSEMRLRVDSTDGAAVQVCDTKTTRTDSAPKEDTDAMKTITIRGKTYKVDAPEEMAAAQAAMADMEKKSDMDGAELAGVKDALMKALQLTAQLEAKLAAATAATPTVTEAMVPEDIADSIARKRLDLRERARRVLGETDAAGKPLVLDGLKASEIRRQVIVKAMPTLKLDGLSDDTLAGMFTALTETAAVTHDPLAEARRVAQGHQDSDRDDADPAAKARAATANRWQQPMTITAANGERTH